jgi:SAM-dependent methyltransferase
LDYNSVIEGNKLVHSKEAAYYDIIHQEIWNKKEQKRLIESLKESVNKIQNNNWFALDFGAGTGNLTEKLLDMGFNVTAVDLSEEMCKIIRTKNKKAVKNGKLTVLCANLDEISLPRKFDFVGCYSVLHHMPDVIQTVKRLSCLVKKGGILYFDHEGSAIYGLPGRFPRTVYYCCCLANGLLYNSWLKWHKIKVPTIDYSKADVQDLIDWHRIIPTLKEEYTLTKKNYFEYPAKFNSVIDFFYHFVVGRNVCCFVGVKNKNKKI